MTNIPLQTRFVAGSSLSELLQRYKMRMSKSQADISRDSWLDESYVSRLLSGQRANPSRDALILLSAFGMGLPVEDVDAVLLAADYKPLALTASLR